MRNDQLLEGCRRGRTAAWRTLMDRYERLVYSIPLSLGLSRDDAADVVQATFGALLDGIDRIEDPERLGAWLSTVARRQSIRVIERLERDRDAVSGATRQPLLSGDEELRIVEDAQWLHRGLAELGPKCRNLLTRLYLAGDEPAYDVVARELGMPVGSIGPTRARCLEQLRRHLADEPG